MQQQKNNFISLEGQSFSPYSTLSPLSPIHYRTGNIDVWDFIIDQQMDFLEGNVIKYVTRYKHKNGVEDLEKARVYLNKLIEEQKILESA
jgi:hypothetical protein